MNTVSIDFQPFIEYDSNPFLLFDPQGKIVYLNNSAEILLGYVDKKTLFALAMEYAPQSYGFRTAAVSLRYDTFHFFSIMVGYENEELLGLRLYNAPRIKPTRSIEKHTLTPTDINLLLEAAITLFKSMHNRPVSLLTDPDIPEVKVDQNRFSKLLRKCFEAFRASSKVEIELKMLLGEHLIVNGKKTSIAQLSMQANGRYAGTDKEIREIAEGCNIRALLGENSIRLEIPLLN